MAVDNHAEISNAKENTDTQSNGVKMSIGEKLETKVVVGAIKDNIDKISKEEVFDVEYDSAVETYKHKSDYVLSVFDEQKNIAYRNDFTDKLVKSLKLGGFPMPSIAVIKSDMGHGNYGECSFVLTNQRLIRKLIKEIRFTAVMRGLQHIRQSSIK